ncbi:MAG: HNH endonuclease [Rhizomicrobium sp.]
MAIPYVPYAGPIVTRAEALETKNKRYFTGIPCIHGHVSERWTSSKLCVGCSRQRYDPEYHAEYYQNNKNEILERVANYRAENPEKFKEYYEKTRDKQIASAKKWREDNREDYLAYCIEYNRLHRDEKRQHYRDNRDRYLELGAEWKRTHKDERRAHKAARRARQLGAEGKWTPADIADLFEKQKGKCAHSWCKVSIKNGYHIDHVISLAKGGDNDKRNLQLLCEPCNLKKFTRHPIDVAQDNGFLL